MFGNFNNFNFPGLRGAFFPNGSQPANNQQAHAHQPAFTGGLTRDEFVPSFEHAGPPPGLAAHIVSQVGSRPALSYKEEFHETTWKGMTHPPAGPHGYPIVEGY